MSRKGAEVMGNPTVRIMACRTRRPEGLNDQEKTLLQALCNGLVDMLVLINPTDSNFLLVG